MFYNRVIRLLQYVVSKMDGLVLEDSWSQAHLSCFVEEKLRELKGNKSEGNWIEFASYLI